MSLTSFRQGIRIGVRVEVFLKYCACKDGLWYMSWDKRGTNMHPAKSKRWHLLFLNIDVMAQFKGRVIKNGVLISFLLLLMNCSGGGGGSSAVAGAAGPSSVGNQDDWLIPVDQVVDGGPGKNGIPAIDSPTFIPLDQAEVAANGFIIGMIADGEARAIPHDIMDWHEVMNDNLQTGPIVLSYCPLTGSALLWGSNESDMFPTFGVSGLLFNSNLILYDRQTDSNWSQMQLRSVEGSRRGEVVTLSPILEMRIERWRELYPDSSVLSRTTGYSRDYDMYPYGSFRSNGQLLFPVTPLDERLHPKERVVGVQIDNEAMAYIIDEFDATLEIINDEVGGVPIVVIGSSVDDFGVIFERKLSDGTELIFTAAVDASPAVVVDNEGNAWDLFGRALAGPRAGQQLPFPQSHIAYWFAWAAFHPGTGIYEF